MAYQSISFRPSTNIAAIQWDPETKDLLVTFVRQGRQYIAHQVDARTAEGFSRAPSAGQYYNNFIRDQYLVEEV